MNKKVSLAPLFLSALALNGFASEPASDNPFTLDQKGLTFEQGDFKLTVGALLQYDVYSAKDDKTHIPCNDNDWRDQRISFAGSYGKDWQFKYNYDFKSISHKDAWIHYNPYQITFGQFKSPVGLENQHSSRYWTFNEPAMLTTIAPQRFVGIMWHPVINDWTFTAAIQKANINDETQYNKQPLRTSTRLTWAPIKEEAEILHLGGSLQWINFEDENRSAKLAAVPEVKGEEMPKLVATRKLTLDSQQAGGLEAGYVYGPLALRGEYLAHRMKDKKLSDTYYFESAYAQASYFLDGETHITYNSNKGVFGKPSNVNKRWEIAARSSWLDLEDGSVKGGKETNYTLGISFYYNLNLRFTLNYIHAEVEDGKKGDEQAQLVSFRTQLAF